jgi:transcriptional regulator of aroF, aroG, tyrA and aromatic amino acid transport
LPLRERPDDIVPLARVFTARLAERQGEVRRLTRDAENRLRRYRWPGNVSELSAVIERAVMRRSCEEIGVEELGLPSI